MLTKISTTLRKVPPISAALLALALSAGLASPGIAKEDKKDKAKSEAPEWPEKLADYKRTGETELCLQITSIRTSRIIDRQHILFETNGKKYYVNELPHRCAGLSSSRFYSYATSLSKLCNTDIIHVQDTIGSGLMDLGACGLGKFERVEKMEKKDMPDAKDNSGNPS